MNYFRRLWTFFFACQVVVASGITFIYAADNTVDINDANVAISKNLPENQSKDHQPKGSATSVKPSSSDNNADHTLLDNRWASGPNKISYDNLNLHSSISPQVFDQQVAQAYQLLLNSTNYKPLLLPAQHKQVKRVRTIVHKLAPYAMKWNEQVKDWQWEVNIIRSAEIRAYGLPGGKIIIYSGLLKHARLNDNQLALLLAHQIAHALREHVRAHLSEAPLIFDTSLTPSLLFGLSHPGIAMPSTHTQLLSVQYSRTDETEADVIGADIAARAGYDPRAALVLWQRLSNMSRHTQVDFVTTHPFTQERMRDMRKRLPELLPTYTKARRKSAAASRAHSTTKH